MLLDIIMNVCHFDFGIFRNPAHWIGNATTTDFDVTFVYPSDVGCIYLSAYCYVYVIADGHINPTVSQHTTELIHLIAEVTSPHIFQA
jgi:hypothetical protein